MTLHVDHVVVSCGPEGLAEYAARLRAEHGLVGVRGGQHEVWGTENLVVALAEGRYLEAVAVADPDVAGATAFGRLALAGSGRSGAPLAWAVGVPEVDVAADRLALRSSPGERRLPDGEVLRWRTAGIEALENDSALPFFITWETPDGHPSQQVGQSGPAGRLVEVVVASQESRLSSWLSAEQLDVAVRYEDGEGGVRRFLLEVDGRPVELG